MNLWLRLVWALFSWRLRGPASIWDVGVRSFRVWPSDLDIFNHMNNGKYGSLMDLARLDLLLRSGTWQRLRKLKWYPVVVAETITFRKSLAPWQKFEIESRVAGWDAEGFLVDQRFTVDGEIYSQVWVRLRFLKNPRGIVTPQQILDEFGAPADNRQAPDWVLEWAKNTALPKGKEAAPSLW
jgi:acyl-CoA thioesterase FadM